MQSIALIQDKEGNFNLNYKEGVLVREESEISFAKHNLLCFGRLNKNFTKNPLLRKGDLLTTLENKLMYSTSWNYYLEGDISLEAMKRIIIEFNLSCERDLKLGLFEQKITLKNILKIGKNSLLFEIKIGGEAQTFTIKI